MEDNEFNAHKARLLMYEYSEDKAELDNVIESIMSTARGTKFIKPSSSLHWYAQLSNNTITELKERGFKIINHPQIAIQKDNLFHTIRWKF